MGGIDGKVGEVVVELLANGKVDSLCCASALCTSMRGQLGESGEGGKGTNAEVGESDGEVEGLDGHL